MLGKGVKVGFGALMAVAILITAISACSSQDKRLPKELKLAAAVGDWSELPKRVVRILLEDELGYEVIVRDASAEAAWPALKDGEIDIFTDVWYPNQKSFADEYVPEQVRIAGDLADSSTGIYTNADQGWLLPKWTRDKYDIDSLYDIAALEPGDALFDELDNDNDGLMELFGGEVGWAVTEINDDKIDYYNKNYDLGLIQLIATHAGGHDEILVGIKRKLDAREDVLFYLWTPHHLFTEYADALSGDDGQILWLEDPWGFFFSPEATEYFTGFPGATIYNAYRSGLENDHPNVVAMLERVRMTIADLNTYCYWESIIHGGEVTGKEKDDYARRWIEDHRAEIDSWLDNP